ncbi:MAG: ferrous iron transport protein A [Planctomycetales bacterium]|nr:ferrous iron transport protein A [Planctomycetales bacterium]
MHGSIPLHLLAPGECGRVASVYGDADQVHRLHELGFREGVEVRMVQSGLPCIIHLDGSRLCIRGADSLCVLVSPTEVAA